MSFKPDRRPAYLFNCVGATATLENPLGFNPDWGKVGFSVWALKRTRELLTQGWPIILFNKPAGGPGQAYVPGCAWGHLPADRRRETEEEFLPGLLALRSEFPKARLGGYFGTPYRSLTSVVNDSKDPAVFDTDRPEFADDFQANIGPWLRAFNLLAFDWSTAIPSGHRPRLIKFANRVARPMGVEVWGEASPTPRQGDTMADCDKIAYMARSQFIANVPALKTEIYNPATTEIRRLMQAYPGVMEGNMNHAQALDWVKRLADKGEVPIVQRGLYAAEVLEVAANHPNLSL